MKKKRPAAKTAHREAMAAAFFRFYSLVEHSIKVKTYVDIHQRKAVVGPEQVRSPADG